MIKLSKVSYLLINFVINVLIVSYLFQVLNVKTLEGSRRDNGSVLYGCYDTVGAFNWTPGVCYLSSDCLNFRKLIHQNLL